MKHHSIRRRQEGVVLIISLVILVLITLVGLSTIRTTTMEEKMAGNSRDRDKALQAAEAVVQACLTQLNAGTYGGAVHTPTVAPTAARWEVSGNWLTGSPASTAINIANAGLAEDPRCLVEALGASGSYRVTGRAVGGSADTVVMLQATYSKE